MLNLGQYIKLSAQLILAFLQKLLQNKKSRVVHTTRLFCFTSVVPKN